MALNDIKEITIPVSGVDKAVKKITDSNGNIIWGSASAFPYRRLEYVICDGTAACDTGARASTGTGWELTKWKTKIKTSSSIDSQQRVIANYTSGATYPRMYPVISSSSGGVYKLQNVIGSNWGASVTVSANTEYVIESSMVYNDRYITVNGAKTTLTSMSSYTASSGNTYGLGAGVNKSNTPIFESGFKGWLYNTTSTSTSGRRTYYYIPVQRKSDNVVGFYRVSVTDDVYDNNGVFLPSTWTSAFGAGPVIDEYFDISVAPTVSF